jgi:hypothetical protein
MPAKFIGYPTAEHVAAFALVHQQLLPGDRRPAACAGRNPFPIPKIGLNLLIKGTAQTIKGIHTFHGFHNPGLTPHTLIVGQAKDRRTPCFFCFLLSHDRLLSLGVFFGYLSILHNPRQDLLWNALFSNMLNL